MIQEIKDSAAAVGVTAFITNSTENIEVQLNTLTKDSDLPIMLVSWDIVTNLSFDEHGFLNNPSANITALLLEKPLNLTKIEFESSAEQMGGLFELFITDLYARLVPLQLANVSPITGANYQLVPKYGLGKHSGILGKWNMTTGITNCKP